jgi:uncharacterized protein YkwD
MLSLARRTRFGVAAAVAAAALAVPGQALASCAHAKDNPNDVSVADAKAATICLLNATRRAHHLRPLHVNGRLSLASQRATNAMEAHHFFSHGDFVGRIRAARYLQGSRGWTVGENIAWGSWDYASPKSIVRSWMHSAPHRANILSSHFREIGIGLTRGAPVSGMEKAATYATDFGTRF